MPAFGTHKTNVVDVAWDAAAQKTKVRSGEKRSYYAKIFAWYDEAADEGNKSDYKFIHHEVAANGDPGDAVVKACTSGIGVLNGGMGGTTIPKADRQGVYDHLAKHLRDAGREPPELSGESFENLPRGRREAERAELLMRASAEIWAILPRALQALLASSPSPQPSPSEGEGAMAMTRPGPKSGRVARVPVFGVISHRDSFWSSLFGGTSVESLVKSMRDIAIDDTISTVLLDIDSPGGTVAGMPELAAEVRRLRESKHVVALANSMAASAAYWIASQADEIVATPEALVGSVGVFAIHEDWSKLLENAGVKISYIAAGKYKTEGNFEEPLSDEARAHLQSIVDDSYGLFVGDVARGRGMSAADVRANYGEGRVLTVKDAKAAGMIDRIAGFDETVRRLAGVKAESIDDADGVSNRLAGVKTESAESTDYADEVSNSLARTALMRRRLEIAEKFYMEVER